MHERCVEQVRLLMRLLPAIAAAEVFALKGGSAINPFYRDMPRLSVDIDLTHVPIENRASSLHHINATLDRIMASFGRSNGDGRFQRIAGGGNLETRKMASRGTARVKIETSPVMRGTVLSPVPMRVSGAVKEAFGFAEMPVVAIEDLFAGKLHAALDRQHPRGLHDVHLLYENEGLTDDLCRAFLVYVRASGRPPHELLAPPAIPTEERYTEEFVEMTREEIALSNLEAVRSRNSADASDRGYPKPLDWQVRNIPAVASRRPTGFRSHQPASGRTASRRPMEACQAAQAQGQDFPACC